MICPPEQFLQEITKGPTGRVSGAAIEDNAPTRAGYTLPV
jgi:hypothetical protein